MSGSFVSAETSFSPACPFDRCLEVCEYVLNGIFINSMIIETHEYKYNTAGQEITRAVQRVVTRRLHTK